MENTIKILNYQMTIADNVNNLRFQKDKVSYRGKTLDAIFSGECKEALKTQMAKKDIKYPVLITLGAHDYFIKSKKFTRKDGTEGEKWIVVITGLTDVEQGEFPVQRSLDDIINDMEKPVDDE